MIIRFQYTNFNQISKVSKILNISLELQKFYILSMIDTISSNIIVNILLQSISFQMLWQ